MRLVLVMVAVVPLASAAAVELPERKPGLWEITTTRQDAPPQAVSICVDHATEAGLSALGTNAAKGMCSKTEINRDGDVLTVDSVCRIGSRQSTTHSVTTFAGDSASHSEIHITFDPPLNRRSETNMVKDAKWMGACPAEMTPGDMLLPNGVKMNIKSMTDAP
jgi:hypothetical protein